MAQRHDGGFGEQHENRLQEQYGGRSRETGRGELRGRHEGWERLRRAEAERYGHGDEDYPRFGSRRSRWDFDRDENELGAFAGRGYDEPSWERVDFGSRGGEPRSGGRGSFEGSSGEHRSAPGGWGRESGYGDFERGSVDRSSEGGRFGQRSFGGSGDAYGGYADRRGFDESPGRGFGGGYGEYGREHGREGAGRSTSQPWRRQGGFAGRGPKGYQRSDERIREEICDILTADPDIDASNLTVEVRNLEVTLEGAVEDRWMKRRAEDAIEGVSGVSQVHNHLQVQPGTRTGGQNEEQTGSSRFGNGSKSTGQS